MSIEFQVLGASGRDNALLVTIDSGQSISRLLFDCGEGCLSGLSLSLIQDIDHLFFSHLHMDHIGGFDSFFRATYNRQTKPNRIWGPPRTGLILQHRFQGYLWNLHAGQNAAWYVHDVEEGDVKTSRYELREAFTNAYEEGPRSRRPFLLDALRYTVEGCLMDHLTPSVAYVVREKPRLNIDLGRLKALGLLPGPWLGQIKEAAPDRKQVEIEGVTHEIADLRKTLLVETPGDSVAYLTDFLLDEAAQQRLIPILKDCKKLVCESQYRSEERALALKNHHVTAGQAAELARMAGVEELVLFHVSDRYTRIEWASLLQEAQRIFPNTRFPPHWEVPLS